MKIRLLGLLGLLVLQSACSKFESESSSAGTEPSPSPTICTQQFVYGIEVTVTDPSGEMLTNAQVTLRDGNYFETLNKNGEGIYQGAGERPGTYKLEVRASGFEPFQQSVTVTKGVCHVNTVQVSARLQR